MLKRGFTLIELMVSIALLLIIMVGVNVVFTATSRTIGANTALSAINRDSRAIGTVLRKDFSNMASDGGSIIIRSQQIFAFNSQPDKSKDTDGDPGTADFTSSGTEAGIPYAKYNERSHRVDRISFFTRQLLRRQTGNDGTFIANQAAMEQWIWLGHLRLPEDTLATFYNPGDTTAAGNVNNVYGTQWALGREAILLADPIGRTPTSPGPKSNGTIKDMSGTSQVFLVRDPDNDGVTTNLTPLDTNSVSTSGTAIQDSRYDLAGTTISNYSRYLTQFVANTANAAAGEYFWTRMMGGPTSRFQAVPFPTRPMTAASAARTAPIIGRGVSTFIVEYAGDFVTQDQATGAITNCYYDPANGNDTGTRDGTDFVMVGGQRQIRWYGFPRSTSGSVTLTAANGDVCPLRDTIQLCPVAGYSTSQAPFERTAPASTTNPNGTNILSAAVPANYFTSTANGRFYIAAWGPADTNRPTMYRITMTFEDANGRLATGQTFEYVFSPGN